MSELPKQRSRTDSNEEFEKGLDEYEKANPNIDAALAEMHEASARGFTMNATATVRKANNKLMEGMVMCGDLPTKSQSFDDLTALTGNWAMAHKILEAVEAGEVWGVFPLHALPSETERALSLLREVGFRMDSLKAKATKAKIAWNPIEVVTHLMIEIENGSYEVI